MKLVRVAVVGAGHLGSIHARLLQNVPGAHLVAVVDPQPEARERIAGQLHVPVHADYRPLLSHLDAVILAAPTSAHYAIGMDVLSHGVHLLVEKPIATSLHHADQLVATAAQRKLVLQVGHVERFNPALAAVRDRLTEVRYVEAVRTSGYTFRSTDIGVVLDLMIHDLDVILSLVQSPISDLQALGMCVLGPHEDMAQARLTFANGCVANLTASRVSYEQQRVMRVVTAELFASIDYAHGTTTLVQPSEVLKQGGLDVQALSTQQKNFFKEHLFRELLVKEQVTTEPINAIQQEQQEFIASIRSAAPIRVSGAEARDALAVAQRILARISAGSQSGPLRKAG